MKKLALLLGCVLVFTGCDIEDDGQHFISYYSEVSEIDLPAYFEEGEKYEIEVTYLLPTECHVPAGLQVRRGATVGDEYRDIYVFSLADMDSDLDECDKEGTDIPTTSSFFLTIDQDEPYTFYLWTGVDEDDKSIFTEIEVPVGEPEPTEPTEEGA